MEHVVEKVMLLGPRKSMVGVLAHSTRNPPEPDRPLVVILNSGIIHRVGPNRMTVVLSRALAASGFAVLRFDLSGIGDSEPREDSLSPWEASLADIREALDSLEATRGPIRVVLAGLCSGADQSVFYGGTDARIVGVVLMDPSVPRTKRYYLNHYGVRAFRMSSWFNLVRGRHPFWDALRHRMAAPVTPPPPPSDDTLVDTPEVRAKLESAYRALLINGIQMLAVCTADRESRVNYREQLPDAFSTIDFSDKLRLEYFEKADHTFTIEAERMTLIGLIVEWVCTTQFRQVQPVMAE
jgi:pimeloyl-ACP methyl ester carboxylesterase